MDPFAIFLKKLADELVVDDVKSIKFLYAKTFPAGYAEKKVKDAQSLLGAMESFGLINDGNIDELYEAFEQLPRRDLFPLLNNYKERCLPSDADKSPSENAIESSCSLDDVQSCVQNISLHDISECVSNGHTTTTTGESGYLNGHSIDEQNGVSNDTDEIYKRAALCLPRNFTSAAPAAAAATAESNDSLPNIPNMDDEKPEEYEMRKTLHGHCLIFNNTFTKNVKLHDGKILTERPGTEKDVKSLTETFTWLGFHVSQLEDKSASEIVENISNVASQADQAGFECFVCCILTHGFNGGMYGNDGSMLRIDQLREIFEDERSKNLFEKPKLFFIQACQGVQDGRGFLLEKDSPVTQDHLDVNPPLKSIATDADLLFFMATTSGKVSWRSRIEGSWFIQTLCGVLQNNAHRRSLLEMLVTVNNEVAKKTDITPEGRDAKQMSDIRGFTLRKKLYFYPPKKFTHTSIS